jgi:hypothetical protein
MTPRSNKQAASTPVISNKSNNMFSSPTRLASPRGTARSPRRVATDSYLFAFLRHTRGIVIVLAIVAFFTLQHRPTIEISRSGDLSFSLFPAVEPPALVPPDDNDDDDDDDDPSSDESSDIEPNEASSISSKPTKSVELDEALIALRSSYNASLHPVFARPEYVQVHLITDVSRVISPPSKFLLDGLERSEYTRTLGLTFLNPRIKTVLLKSKQPDRPMVWMADWGSMNRDCHRLKRALDHLGREPSDTVVLMDFSASSRQTYCDFWDKNVRLAKRTIVQDRYFDLDEQAIQPGTIVENSHGTVHVPLVLREKFMGVIQNISTNILSVKRPIDVAFFWKNGDYSHYGFQRRIMSKVVKTLHHGVLYNHSVEAFVGVAANDEEGMVEGNVQLEYVQKLVSSKIVVIAQRDEWEDHYRLMESLASGALVMTDQMLAAPAGLKNMTNVIIYDSPSSLKRLIRYYLKHNTKRQAIAKKGFELAAGRNRAWHRIEEVLFGRPLTHVDLPYEQLPKQPRPKSKLVKGSPFFAR